MKQLLDQLNQLELNGWLGSDPYSTAWVALVPSVTDLSKPAWPQALDYLRLHQLHDGGWGQPNVYYAHERVLATMAAIWALHVWSSDDSDRARVSRGLKALSRYARDLAHEPHEPVGFELVLPRLISELVHIFGARFALSSWETIQEKGQEKLALIGDMQLDPASPRTWWFSMEMLADTQLGVLDDTFLDANGAIAASCAATAAYLRARRYAGHDSEPASRYLETLLVRGEGSVPVGWPFDTFERVWALDSFMRAGLDPSHPAIAAIAQSLSNSWSTNQPGLAFADAFPVNDGDDTLVGFTVLNWSGMTPDPDALLTFWDHDHFRSYLDERGSSTSVNIHALAALSTQRTAPYITLAHNVTRWLLAQLDSATIFNDKWHLSPFYSIAHAIPALAGWDSPTASRCIKFILDRQHADGGWGWSGTSTLEESAHCVLGLYQALGLRLLRDTSSLTRAARFFTASANQEPVEHLWIGKTLYRPKGIVTATILAARIMLERLHQADTLRVHNTILPHLHRRCATNG